MTKKKVLILSASIGTGHTQAARAIEEYIKTIPEECEVEHLDCLSITSSRKLTSRFSMSFPCCMI